MWHDRQLTSFSFMFPLPIAQIMWIAYGRCSNHVFFCWYLKVATAHLVLCISCSFIKITKNVGVKHYIWWFHCCSIFVVYFIWRHFYMRLEGSYSMKLFPFSFLVEKSLLLLPCSIMCDMNVYMKECLLCLNFCSVIIWGDEKLDRDNFLSNALNLN